MKKGRNGKRILLVGLLMGLCAAGMLFAGGQQDTAGGGAAGEEGRTADAAASIGEIKVALDSPPDLDKSGTYVWANAFIEHIKAEGVEPKIFQRDALGGEEEKLDQVSQGLLEVSMSDLAMVGSLDKMVFGFAQPYMFKSLAHLDRTLENSDLMDRLNASISKKGVRLLALVSAGSPGGIANTKKPIRTPADLKGIRLRAKDGMQAEFIKAMGASTVVVPWSEIYNALQTGVADGYINPAVVPLMFKHEEILKYYSDIRFSVSLRVAICSEDWYQGLSDESRELIDKAVEAGNAANRDWEGRISDKALEDLEAAGIEVYDSTDEDISMFSDLVKPVYQQTIGKELADEFLQAAQANQ